MKKFRINWDYVLYLALVLITIGFVSRALYDLYSVWFG